MKRKHYGRSSSRENRQLQRGQALKRGISLLQKEVDQRTQALQEKKPVLAQLIQESHQRYLEELSLFSIRREIYCREEAIDQIADLLSQNPSRVGKLWIAFRAYRPLTLFLGKQASDTDGIGKTYVKILEEYGKSCLSYFKSKQYPVTEEEVLHSDFWNVKTYVLAGLHGVYLEHQTPIEITQLLQPLLDIPPKEEYPVACSMKRHFILHVGGTNTGKTYGSLQRLKEAESGYYLAPLRLLALEVQESLREQGVDCGLLTGEEEDLADSNTHIASTMEKLQLRKKVEVAVLDECQMLADHDRGYAWTRAVLGCPAAEIHCCVAKEGLDILIQVIESGDCSYQVEEHQRLVPLHYLPEPVPFTKAESGDAFVAFSRREVLRIAQEFRDMGIKASVIYGALPYKARKFQMEQFLAGETQVIVATDAIGMGLNLPIRRVIFTENEKFDGVRTRALLVSEVKQIGGRAGRFGKYPQGFVASISPETSVYPQFMSEAPAHTTARLGFSDEILEIDYPLEDILKAWEKTNSPPPFLKTSVERHIKLLNMLARSSLKLSKLELFQGMNIPFNEDNEELFQLFLEYLRESKGDSFTFPTQAQENLMGQELYDKKLDLYYSFSAMFHRQYEKERLLDAKNRTAENINRLLMESVQKNPIKQKNTRKKGK